MLEKIKNYFNKDIKLKALIISPSKNINWVNVNAEDEIFQATIGGKEQTFFIKQEAIYFLKKQPLLIYINGCPEPLIFNKESYDFVGSGKEVNSIARANFVQDLVNAGKKDMNLHEMMVIGILLVSVLTFLNVTGILVF